MNEPQGDRETRQTLRRMAVKAAKKVAREDPKGEGLTRGDWRKILGR
jgi:hypothetical protein